MYVWISITTVYVHDKNSDFKWMMRTNVIKKNKREKSNKLKVGNIRIKFTGMKQQ